MKKIKVLFLAAELTPLAKVGGLGDVAGSLPPVLRKMGVDIRIILPYYEQIKKNKTIKTKKIIPHFYQTKIKNTPLYLLEDKTHLSQGPVYENPNAFVDSFGEFERFLFFSKNIFNILEKINFVPDIIHCNDWHTAAVITLLKSQYNHHPKFNQIKTLYTIHNLANQGGWQAEAILNFLEIAGTKNFLTTARDGYNNFNLMQQGILGADLINTVSPNYAKEIITKEYSNGREKDLLKRKKSLFGIINGIDTDRFNPQKDKNIKRKFSQKTLHKKYINKSDLQKITGLPVDKNIPLIGTVGRISYQKGFNLIEEIIPELSKEKYQLILLGTGDPTQEKSLGLLSKKYPNQFRALIKFDATLAQKIYAGCDIFLVPSKFEPCGLTQMIAMNYGTVPIVRSTGGLKDTVKDKRTGFVFNKFDSKNLLQTIKQALVIYNSNKKLWRKIQTNGMKKDFSWKNPANEYLKLYKKLINNY